MFENIEAKLKTLAKVVLVFCIALAVVSTIFSTQLQGYVMVAGFIVSAFWVIVALVSSIKIYAFAELLENVKEVNSTLKIGFAEPLSAHDIVALQEKKRIEAAAERISKMR